MRFGLTSDQRALRAAVREFLERESPPATLRDLDGSPTGHAPDLWKGLAELGVLGLMVPAELGGLGLGPVEMALVLEEAGRAALREPLVETACAAVSLLTATGGHEWLKRIAGGHAIVAATGFHPNASGLPVTDYFLIEPGAQPIPYPGTGGLADRLADLGWDQSAGDSAVEMGTDSELEEAFDHGAMGAAAELIGVAGRVIEMAAEHARNREQFGRPIGTFQAVKHLLADALIGVEFASPAVYRAAWSLGRKEPTRSRDASMAKALASDACTRACRGALQVHGAIGYTFEHDLHLWLTRGWALANQWGTPAWHRVRVGTALLSERGVESPE